VFEDGCKTAPIVAVGVPKEMRLPIQRVLAGVLLVGIVAGGLGGFLVSRSSIGLDEGRISTLIDQRIEATAPADDVSVTSVSLGPLVEEYLVENPRVLERISLALNAEIERERRAKSKAAIEENRELIYSGEGAVVVGNPNGDVTLVELYDYNCGYCRSSMPEVAALLAEDSNLRLVLRQFPILSQGSVDAAKVGTLVAGEGCRLLDLPQSDVYQSRAGRRRIGSSTGRGVGT
jgi:hypothetical protein